MATPVDSDSGSTASHSPELTRYVRVRNVLDDKFVEFDFAIGDPSLYVELVLPREAFDIFCRHNQVEFMTEEQARAVDADMQKWRYGDSVLTDTDTDTDTDQLLTQQDRP